MSAQRFFVVSSTDDSRIALASGPVDEARAPHRGQSVAATTSERVVETLLDLQAQVPYVAALLTIRRTPDGPDVPLFSYRMTPEHVHAGITQFVPYGPELALVLGTPRNVLDWTRIARFRETEIARRHLLAAGFTQGVSFALQHDQRVVGAFHINVVHTSGFGDGELDALDRARDSLEAHVSSFVLAGDVGLTERETQVLRLMSDGSSNARIGEQLQVSRYTPASHVESILRKLKASNRIQAVRIAASLGVL